MQLVMRIEKDGPPSRTAVCEAAAIAVATLLTADEAAGPWRPAIDRWLAGRIRKHCRRARGAKWRRAQAPEGVTVAHAGAEVRAYVPTPLDELPDDVARLQLRGSEVDDPDARTVADPTGAVLVVSLQPEPFLPLGKAAAAAGHASQLAMAGMAPAVRERWALAGFPVLVEQPDPGRFARLVADAPVVVHDAGFTEVAPGTVTAVARWRNDESRPAD